MSDPTNHTPDLQSQLKKLDLPTDPTKETETEVKPDLMPDPMPDPMPAFSSTTYGSDYTEGQDPAQESTSAEDWIAPDTVDTPETEDLTPAPLEITITSEVINDPPESLCAITRTLRNAQEQKKNESANRLANRKILCDSAYENAKSLSVSTAGLDSPILFLKQEYRVKAKGSGKKTLKKIRTLAIFNYRISRLDLWNSTLFSDRICIAVGILEDDQIRILNPDRMKDAKMINKLHAWLSKKDCPVTIAPDPELTDRATACLSTPDNGRGIPADGQYLRTIRLSLLCGDPDALEGYFEDLQETRDETEADDAEWGVEVKTNPEGDMTISDSGVTVTLTKSDRLSSLEKRMGYIEETLGMVDGVTSKRLDSMAETLDGLDDIETLQSDVETLKSDVETLEATSSELCDWTAKYSDDEDGE